MTITPPKTSRRRRSFGQHFLTNPKITDKIVQLAGVQAGSSVLEVGPGKGILTDSLLRADAHVIAVEKDERLIAGLTEKYRDEEKFQLIHNDFLKVDIAATFSAQSPLKVVANLPYSVGTEIIFRLLDHRELFESFTVMVQKEVADRLVAVPDNKQYGILSVLTQLYCESKIVLRVPPGAFHPPPKVDSAVVHMTVSDTLRVPVRDEKVFKRLVKQGFAQRRKQLRNNLQIDTVAWDEICAHLQCEPKTRAENLSLLQWAQLADWLTD